MVGDYLDIVQVAVLLLGVTLGWLVMFAVRRYRVQWGAFASFMSVILGISLVKFLYAQDLLPYYAIGIFVGFFANVFVRLVGKVVGGRVGDGLLEISVYKATRQETSSEEEKTVGERKEEAELQPRL